jgi:hypothetical protein
MPGHDRRHFRNTSIVKSGRSLTLTTYRTSATAADGQISYTANAVPPLAIRCGSLAAIAASVPRASVRLVPFASLSRRSRRLSFAFRKLIPARPAAFVPFASLSRRSRPRPLPAACGGGLRTQNRKRLSKPLRRKKRPPFGGLRLGVERSPYCGFASAAEETLREADSHGLTL